jgi:hypothetical protein
VFVPGAAGGSVVGLQLRPYAEGDTYSDVAPLAGGTAWHERGETGKGRTLDLFSLTDHGVLYQVGVNADVRDQALLAKATAGLRIVTRVPAEAEPLAWLPAEAVSVVGASRGDAPSLHVMTRYAGSAKRPPPCIADVTSRLTASYQFWVGAEDHESTGLAQGAIDRNAMENCLESALRALDTTPRLTRRGAVTQVEDEIFGRVFVGWTSSWVVWHSDRARVQKTLAALRGKTLAPALAAVLARVDRSGMWSASLRDVAGSLLGVPSRSMTLESSSWKEGADLYVTFDFGSGAAAERAKSAAKALVADETLPADLRAAARNLDPTVDGGFLHLNLEASVWMKPSTMATVQAIIEKKQADRRRMF